MGTRTSTFNARSRKTRTDDVVSFTWFPRVHWERCQYSPGELQTFEPWVFVPQLCWGVSVSLPICDGKGSTNSSELIDTTRSCILAPSRCGFSFTSRAILPTRAYTNFDELKVWHNFFNRNPWFAWSQDVALWSVQGETRVLCIIRLVFYGDEKWNGRDEFAIKEKTNLYKIPVRTVINGTFLLFLFVCFLRCLFQHFTEKRDLKRKWRRKIFAFALGWGCFWTMRRAQQKITTFLELFHLLRWTNIYCFYDIYMCFHFIFPILFLFVLAVFVFFAL